MIFCSHIFTPNTTGSPDYNICGQASSVVDFTNLKLKLVLTDGTISQVLVDTTDLSTLSGFFTGVISFPKFDINVLDFEMDSIEGVFYTLFDFLKTGETDPSVYSYTQGKVYLQIEIEQTDYITYSNTIQVYGYDIGNSTEFGINTGKDCDIYLVRKNLGALVYPKKSFSNFIILKQPFTNNVFIYNLVANHPECITKYYNNTTGGLISQSLNTSLQLENNCSSNYVNILQRVELLDITNTLIEYCVLNLEDNNVNWIPTISSTSSCVDCCNDNVNNISELTAEVVIDYTNVTPFYIEMEKVFLTQFMTEEVIFSLYDYTDTLVTSDTQINNVVYNDWIINPSAYLIPLSYTIFAPPLGDCEVVIENKYSFDSIELLNQKNTIVFKTCNWWNVTKGELCGDYLINNCSSESIDVVLQQMQEDKSFSDISTTTITSNSSAAISLQGDGIYLLKVASRTEGVDFDYYSIVNFCKIESCWLAFLNQVLCHPPKDNCDLPIHYKFNTFLINAHTFFIALNEEFNFNFIYTSITDERVNNLYTLYSFIERLSGYCDEVDTDCIPCKDK